MTNETTENFISTMASFVWPESKVLEYRLYYNQDGMPLCYSMDELPGKYVKVDAEIFALRPWNVKVVDDNLILIDPPVTVQKLQPNQQAGTPCHPQDVCVVVQKQPYTKWNKTTNEIS